ncbi:MAG: hypothetical protein PHY47_25795 [Lachnospiraceae bacterium]|nr:hypothetical protein [Lachnospiraceae bacterium]
MKLKKVLQITKSKGFSVFVYPAGHVAFARGLDESFLSQFNVFRGHDGKIKESDELCKYANARVEEIIPCCSTVTIVVEI